jgi:hypothetical protein
LISLGAIAPTLEDVFIQLVEFDRESDGN